MLHGRAAALALALVFAAGCAGAGIDSTAPPTSAVPQGLDGSSAARFILAHAGTASRSPQSFGRDGNDDDGDWGTLQLPFVQSCGNGTLATDCAVWAWTSSPRGPRDAARSAQSVTPAGTPPVLNFCRDASLAPFGFSFAAPVVSAGPSPFALAYTGTHAPPIATFATRRWNVDVQGTFSSTATIAPNGSVSPLLADGASRGWLVFFTWSWPADILLVPYAINEIQLRSGSSPLTVPRSGSAELGAFDCLNRGITARRSNASFGFAPSLRGDTLTAANPLAATVYGGSNPSGSIALGDDRGARTTAQVVAGPAPGR
ncbi:MAG TPA: hypothetical protein VGC96_07440 [Candidatus Elarobacter sp.]|jgi:hypothetical protein